MKKILGISLVALFTVAPFAADAALTSKGYVDGKLELKQDVENMVTDAAIAQGTTDAVKKTKYPSYYTMEKVTDQKTTDLNRRLTEAENNINNIYDETSVETNGNYIKAYDDETEEGTVVKNLGYLDTAVKTNANAISNEVTRATGVESGLDTRLTGAETKILTLNGADTVEGSVAKAKKDAKDYADGLDAAMDARVDVLESAAGADGTLAQAIKAEETRAKGVEGNTTNLTTDAKNNLVAAINEVDTHANTAQREVDALEEKVGTIASGKTVAGLISDNANAIAAINDTSTGILAQAKEDATTKADTAESNAKSYADDLKEAIDVSLGALAHLEIPANCKSSGSNCVLVYKGSATGFVLEDIERANGEDASGSQTSTLATLPKQS